MILLEIILKVEYSNCRTNNLRLSNVMNTWTKQMGHPLVKVRLLNQTHISVSQSHFLLDASSQPPKSPYE
jgi:aminopeptidase N